MVDEGKFNDELFYRVASLPLQMPALRDRKEDIPLLIRHFTARASNPLVDPNLIEFTADAMAILTAYDWPGNVRELRNTIERATILAGSGTIGVDHLPPNFGEPGFKYILKNGTRYSRLHCSDVSVAH